MATTVEECEEIVRLTEEAGLSYMMMETVVYAREFLFMKDLYDKGELGKIQYLKQVINRIWMAGQAIGRVYHQCTMLTHCVGPVLGLTRGQAESVSCFGSGTIREELHGYHNSPFAVESCHIKFKDSDVVGHVYRSLFDVARQYRESIEVYGSKQSVEWPLY